MSRLTVSIVTPAKKVISTEVDMVIAPSAMGEIGILPQHRSLLSDLVEGVLSLRAGDKTERYAISGGFIEVQNDRVAVLAETVEPAAEIDTARAQSALQDSESKLKKLDPISAEYAEQSARAGRARARLAAVQ